MDLAQKSNGTKKAAVNRFQFDGIVKHKITQGTMDLFGLPLTETLTIENKLETALYIVPQVRCLVAFLRYERHLMIRGETTVHNTGQRHNTGHRRRGNNTQGALQRPREQQGRKKVLLNETFGHFKQRTVCSRLRLAE